MTLDEIKAIPKDFLTVTDIAPYIKGDPQAIRTQAFQRPELLGFPVTIVGRRVKIPKALFVQHFQGGDTRVGGRAVHIAERSDCDD